MVLLVWLFRAGQNPVIPALGSVDTIFVVSPNESVVKLIIKHGVSIVGDVEGRVREICIQDLGVGIITIEHIFDGELEVVNIDVRNQFGETTENGPRI
jgi:hypothetical protein